MDVGFHAEGRELKQICSGWNPVFRVIPLPLSAWLFIFVSFTWKPGLTPIAWLTGNLLKRFHVTVLTKSLWFRAGRHQSVIQRWQIVIQIDFGFLTPLLSVCVFVLSVEACLQFECGVGLAIRSISEVNQNHQIFLKRNHQD